MLMLQGLGGRCTRTIRSPGQKESQELPNKAAAGPRDTRATPCTQTQHGTVILSRWGQQVWSLAFYLSFVEFKFDFQSNLMILWKKKFGCCKKPQGAEVPFCFHCKVLRPADVQLINHHFSHYCLCKLQRKVRIYSSIPTLSSGTKLPYLSPWIATNPRIF